MILLSPDERFSTFIDFSCDKTTLSSTKINRDKNIGKLYRSLWLLAMERRVFFGCIEIYDKFNSAYGVLKIC